MKFLAMILVAIAIGCTSNGTTETAPWSPTMSIPKQISLGTSVKGAPITMERFGSSPNPVLVMGGIHGNERTTVYVTQQFVEYLRQHPEVYRNVSVAIIPVANPDGYAASTRTNARGVDLNRNFPAKNFAARNPQRAATRSRGMYYGGAEPLSEPESQALHKVLDQLQPRLIISIHSIGSGRQCNNYDGPAEAIAQLMSRYNHYPATASIGYATPGSLGSYAGIDRQIPMITLELPNKTPGEEAWDDNREALVAAIQAVGR